MAMRFGKYVVEGELGRGGFGRVYCAFDADMNRRVAIKVLACESDPDLLSRFHAEAGTTARLAHRNIVTVFEFAQQDGLPYLVMELLEGSTLHEMIGSGAPLSLLDKAEIMYQVAEGLQHAHSRGVIHRDIKPGNIMVLPDGRVKIMDFGIARLMQREGARRTREGDLIGTVSYMAPEMFREHEPDKKTDIFAYGVVYYELLTCEHPFHAADAYATIHRIENDEPAPLRKKLLHCPDELAILLQHLLTKDREMRLDDMSDVLFDTEPILRNLRQERASALAKEIGPLIEKGDCEMAYARVKQILELDPAHAEARLWRDQIRTRLNRQRAEKLRYQGMEHMSARRFREAVTCFESVLHLDTNKSEILELLERARAAVEGVRRSAALVKEARAERQKGNIEQAFSRASQAVELDPANRDAVSLQDSLGKQIRELQLSASLEKVEQLRRAANFDSALAVLERIEVELQGDARVQNFREQISQERKQAQQRQRILEFQGMLDKAREALEAGLLEQAADSAQSLCVKFPEQPAAAAFREEVRGRVEQRRRRESITALTQTILRLSSTDRFDEAQALIADGLQKYPSEPKLTELAKDIAALATAHRRAVVNQKIQQRADEVSNEGDFDRAQARQKMREDKRREDTRPKPASVSRTSKSDTAEPPLGQREQAISEGRHRAAALARESSLVTAVALLEKLARRYPNSSEVRRDLEAAHRELNYQREIKKRGKRNSEEMTQRKHIEKKRKEAMALLKEGEIGSAMAVIRDLLRQYRK